MPKANQGLDMGKSAIAIGNIAQVERCYYIIEFALFIYGGDLCLHQERDDMDKRAHGDYMFLNSLCGRSMPILQLH